MKNYVKYIVCPLCDEGYYTNEEGDYTHIEVVQLVCERCILLMQRPEED